MLDFLNQITVAEVVEAPAKKGGGNRKERIPTNGLKIRVFRDGSVYPSQELVDKFNLEYWPKDSMEPGNGLDVIDSDQYSDLKTPQRVIWVSPVSKKHGKVDLFAAVGYNSDNSPKSTVQNQGANTYGKEELLPMIKEVYGLELTKESETDFIDLQLVANPSTGKPWELPRAVTYIPKQVSRGKDKGSYSTVRREKPEFWVLYPVSLIEGTKPQNSEETDTEDAAADHTLDKAIARHRDAVVVE